MCRAQLSSCYVAYLLAPLGMQTISFMASEYWVHLWMFESLKCHNLHKRGGVSVHAHGCAFALGQFCSPVGIGLLCESASVHWCVSGHVIKSILMFQGLGCVLPS